jgi:dipeptidyl aminopeptidase/acylaminoacyl peptidase
LAVAIVPHRGFGAPAGNEVTFLNVFNGKRVGGLTMRDTAGKRLEIGSVAFSPDGQRVASGLRWANRSDGIALWDMASGGQVRTFSPQGVAGLVFSPDGSRLAALTLRPENPGYPDRLAVWEVPTGSLVRDFVEAGNEIRAAAFSPDGRLLASATAQGARVWDLASGEPRLTLSEPAGSVAFSVEGSLLAVGEAQGISLWEVATGQKLSPLPGGTGRPVFSPDGRLAAYVSGYLRLWGIPDTTADPALRILLTATPLGPVKALPTFSAPVPVPLVAGWPQTYGFEVVYAEPVAGFGAPGGIVLRYLASSFDVTVILELKPPSPETDRIMQSGASLQFGALAGACSSSGAEGQGQDDCYFPLNAEKGLKVTRRWDSQVEPPEAYFSIDVDALLAQILVSFRLLE